MSSFLNMLKFLFIALALLATPAAADVSATDLAECARIDSAIARLDCFDQLARSAVEGVTARDETGLIVWQRVEHDDAMTDAHIVTIVNTLDDPLPCAVRQPPSLILQCQDGTVRLAFVHECIARVNFGNFSRRLLTRWGDTPAEEIPARVGPDHDLLYWETHTPTRGTVWTMIDQMLAHDRLTIRFNPDVGRGGTVTFDLAGLAPLLAQGGDSCGLANSVQGVGEE